MIKEIKDYKNAKVWVTRKSRVLAEQRMLRSNMYSSILLTSYSFFLICFSILEFTNIINNEFPFILMMSVGVFAVSIYIPTMAYVEKAHDFKDSYIKLERLESKLGDLIILIEREEIDNKEAIRKYKKIKSAYNNTLKETSNHSDIDYIRLKRQEDLKLNSVQSRKLWLSRLNWLIYCISLLIFPILMLVVYFKNG